MAKKQAQFRFEEDFLYDIKLLADKEGINMSEVVRNALRLYAALHKRTKDKDVRFFIETEGETPEKCEVLLPWLSLK